MHNDKNIRSKYYNLINTPAVPIQSLELADKQWPATAPFHPASEIQYQGNL